MYGRQLLGQTGRAVQVTFDGKPQWPAGGTTLDWATVAAPGAPATLADQTPIAVGQKFLRFGQVICKITASGKWGPYDPGAADGRQLLTRGNVRIINVTTLQFANPQGLVMENDEPQVIEGGVVWRDRLIATAGAASLAAGPTYVNLEAALPGLRYAQNA